MCVLDGVNARSLPGFGWESYAWVRYTGFTDGTWSMGFILGSGRSLSLHTRRRFPPLDLQGDRVRPYLPCRRILKGFSLKWILQGMLASKSERRMFMTGWTHPLVPRLSDALKVQLWES